MDFVLVFPLMLTFLSAGQSHAEFTEQQGNSRQNCQSGHYKPDGDCSVGKLRCEKCGNGTYTDIPNCTTKCLRCKTCGNYEMVEKPCSFKSNVVCKCKLGYFYKIKPSNGTYSQKPSSEHCMECTYDRKDLHDYPDYKRQCTTPPAQISSPTNSSGATPTPTSASASASASTSASTSAYTRTTNNTSSPVVDLQPDSGIETPWLILVLVLVTLLVTLLVFLLLFVRNPFRYPDSCLGYPDSCLCWSVNKELVPPVEDPKLNEQCGHQGSSPNALTFNISEETPMMTLSPAAPEHLTHITPLLPDTEHKAARQEEPSEHWPAIVLYAIIKEVPLRRWKEFLRLLSVADQQLERVELEAGLGLGSMERQYQMLRLWSQRSSASLNDVFSALHYMDLSGCAQLLQESLEKLQ